MSIRGIDTNLIVPRTMDVVKDTAAQQQAGAINQQFSNILTEQTVEHKAQMPNEVLKSKDSDVVDEDGQGSNNPGAQSQARKRKQEEDDPTNNAGFSESHIDIKI